MYIIIKIDIYMSLPQLLVLGGYLEKISFAIAIVMPTERSSKQGEWCCQSFLDLKVLTIQYIIFLGTSISVLELISCIGIGSQVICNQAIDFTNYFPVDNPNSDSPNRFEKVIIL